MGSEMIAFCLAIFRIAGLLLLAIAGVRLFNWRELLGGLRLIMATKTSTADELQDVIQAIQDNLGDANIFREKVELKGAIYSDTPIIAELSQKPCVYVRTWYEDKFEETYKDEEENRFKIRYTSEVLADNIQAQVFHIEDQTGRILVNPNGAEFELTQVVNRFEPNEAREKIGKRRKVGRQYNEWILPVGIQVYVFGEISCSGNDFVVQKPLKKEVPFIITRDSEENLTREKQQKARKAKNDGLISLAISIFLLFIAPKVLLLMLSYF
ncbi:MAG: E3 ubiquitin ligase family protein [Cyanobacteria bacterium P01_H01_bin.105]